MKKRCYEDEALIKFLYTKIDKMKVAEDFKPLLVDILLRRAYEFSLSKEDIKQDVTSLVSNLKSIEVRELSPEEKHVGGYYHSGLKKIVINKSFVQQAKKEKSAKLYEILTHEVYHALCRDEKGRDRLESINTITGQHNYSLLEAIVEKAADRCVFSRNRGVAPYFNQNVFGYSDITFITDAIAATYGVSEKDFLRNAIMGRDRLVDFLSQTGSESKRSTIAFLDKIEANYSRLHNTLYPYKKDKKPMSKERKVNNIKDSMLGIYCLCEEKFAERLERTEVKGARQATRLSNEAKFNHNKLTFVMENALQNFSNRYNRPDIMYDVCRDVEDSKIKATYKISDITEVLRNFSRIPYSEILNLINDSKAGKLQYYGSQQLNNMGIVLRDYRRFQDDSQVKQMYFYMDFPEETWENDEVMDYITRVCSRNYKKGFVEKAIKRLFSRQKKVEASPEEGWNLLNSSKNVSQAASTNPFYKVSSTPRILPTQVHSAKVDREENIRD